MAAQIVHSAQTVGDAFARQYYAILQHSPELVHRFYKDMSKIDRFDSDIESMLSTTTMKAIDEKIQSYGSLKADVKFVDAQESYNEGVIVLVIGSMVNEDDSRRNFTQTFFLAPQDNGYYVLNDIFRYVDDDDPDSNEQDGDISPVTSNLEPPPIEENHDSEQLNGGEVYYPSELPVEVVKEQFQVDEKFEEKEPVPELPVEVVKEEFQVEEKFEEKEPVPEVVEETPQQSWVVVESSAKVEGTSKKSYASIVMKDAPSTMSLPTPSKSVSKIQNHQVPVLPATKSVAVPQSSNTETVEDVDNQNLEGGVHSIYVRNLPMNIPVSVVEEVFQEFGPIRSNGIQILHHRAPFRPWQYTTSCFGFVEFETAVAALSAIEASPIYIEGHRVGVEEKKSTAKRAYSNDGNSPGRYPPGEKGGSGLLSEGDRGHGGYEEGRGYGGRGDSNKSEFGGRRGVYEEGRGYGERGDGNKSEFGGRRGGYDEGRGYGGRGDGNKSEFGGRRGGYGGGRGDGGRGDGNKSEFGGRHGGYEGGRGYGGRGDSNKSEFGGRRGGGRGYHTRSEVYQKSDQTGNKSGRMNCGVESSHTSTRPRPRPQRVSA